MSKSRNAAAVIFGFDYQVDAAICLFLRDIERIEKIKVEGKFEDIEEFFEDDSIVYCQVKSVYDPKVNRANTGKLKKAIETLSSCPIRENDSLLYCSNQEDLLIKDSPLFSANTVLMYKYGDLDEKSKKLIDKYFLNHSSKKQERISIIKIPYNVSQDISTKRSFIIQEAKEFLIKVCEDPANSTQLVATWHDYFSNSATCMGKKFFISKNEFIWVIIAHLLRQGINKIEINDESLIEDIEKEYEGLINNRIMNFEISNKLIGIYKEQLSTENWTNIKSFVYSNLNELSKLIYGYENITKIELAALHAITSSVLKMRTRIDRIKKGAKVC